MQRGVTPPAPAHHRWQDPLMSFVLVVLALLALLVGWLGSPLAGNLFGELVHYGEVSHEEINWGLAILASAVALLGILLAWVMYGVRWISAADIAATFGGLYTLLVKKYYFDDIYQWLVNKVVLALAALVAVFDRQVVNNSGVDGAAKVTALSGGGLRYHITGKLYNYALVFLLGVAALTVLTIVLSQGG